MHADKIGTHSYNAQRLLLGSIEDAIVLRLKDQENITQDHWRAICDSTRKNVGISYAYKKAIQAGLNSLIKKNTFTNSDNSSLLYCSLLISEAYKCVEIDLCPGIELCTPGDIANSPLLYQIPSPVRRATDSDFFFAKDKAKDKMNHQAKATNFILQKSRRTVSPKIVEFQDIYKFALNSKNHDLQISKIIQESGYLRMPELLLRDTPWRYDYSAFQELGLPEPERHFTITAELERGNRQVEKYESVVGNYQDQYEKTKLLCLHVQLGAFKKMLEISYKSQILFTNLLREYTAH